MLLSLKDPSSARGGARAVQRFQLAPPIAHRESDAASHRDTRDSAAGREAGKDVHMPASVDRALRSEMMRRMNTGRVLHGERTSTKMTMRHIVLPPAWRLAVDLINPLVWLFGVTWTEAYRTLIVLADEDGRLHRRTTGKIPNRWPQHYSWEVPDGPIEP